MDRESEMQIRTLYEFMQAYALRAGKILMGYRGKVKDKGKDPANSIGIDQEEGGLALSIVDEIVQEGFLWELSRFDFSSRVRINCEENTTLRELFRGNTGELRGTLELREPHRTLYVAWGSMPLVLFIAVILGAIFAQRHRARYNI